MQGNALPKDRDAAGRFQLYSPYLACGVKSYANIGKYSDGSTSLDALFYPTNSNGQQYVGDLDNYAGDTAMGNNDVGLGPYITATDWWMEQNEMRHLKLDGWTQWVRELKAVRALHYLQKDVSDNIIDYLQDFQMIDLGSSKFIGMWYDQSEDDFSCAIFTVATDGTLSVGTIYDLTTGGPTNIADFGASGMCLIDTNKVAFVYENSSGNYGAARVGTISGDTISLGTEAAFETSGALNYSCSVTKLDTDKFIVGWSDNPAGNCRYVAATVSTTTISFGSSVQASAGGNYSHTQLIQNGTDKALAIISDSSQASMWALSMTVSGTTITLGSEVAFSTAATNRRLAGRGSNNGSGYLKLLATDKVLFNYGRYTANVYDGQQFVVITMSGNVVTINEGSDELYVPYSSVSGSSARYNSIMMGVVELSAGSKYTSHYHDVGSAPTAGFITVDISGTAVTLDTAGASYSPNDNGNLWDNFYATLEVIGDYIVVIGQYNTTSFRYSVFLKSATVEMYHKDTIIGSAHTLYGNEKAVLALDQAINARVAYVKAKLTSATSTYLEVLGALFLVD